MTQYIVPAIMIGYGAYTGQYQYVAMGVAMLATSIISKSFANENQPNADGASETLNPGSRQQVSPSTSNKLPIVYGSAYVGGIVTDLSITEDNQYMYYVISISEVTGNGTDNISYGDIYYAGKKVIFNANGYTVDALLDESTGVSDTSVANYINIYLYSSGSNTPTNSVYSAIEIMQNPSLVYQWDATKLMTNCAFAIIKLQYSQTRNIRGIQQTRFQIINSRSNTGDCFYDYLTNTVYGAAIPANQIDTNSLDELTAYSNELITYYLPDGITPATQPRFKFNGVLETNINILANMQSMADCCNCLIRYDEINAKWGVIVQKPTNVPVMNINDSNMVSSINITPIDIAGSYNVVETKFPDSSYQDSFNVCTFDLAQIEPELLYPNEPVNKFVIALPLINNNVSAQLIAIRMLKSAREDLQLSCDVNFIGIQLEAGDVVTVTNANYGWVAKEFRILKVTDQFNDDGSIYCKLNLSEFNGAVYDDMPITEFILSPNSGLSSPTVFGNVPAPVVVSQSPSATVPFFTLNVTTSQAGIIQYAEIWYSAFPNPLEEQMYFAGTSEIQSNGNPWQPNTLLPSINLTNIPSGDYYFFSRMVNSLASSAYSPASALVQWRPLSFQYVNRYLAVAYADNILGGGFSLLPTNKDWFGLSNQATSFVPSDPNAYTWYPANPAFGITNFLLYTNRQNRRFTFGVGEASFASQTGAYVPSDNNTYDQSIWAALSANHNLIDLDLRTGQLLTVGTSTVSPQDGLIKVTNTETGKVVAALERFLNFGPGVIYKTSSVASLTVDIYGRVVGFTDPDNFYYTQTVFNASAGQDTFSLAHTVGNILIFQNGSLLGSSDYTEDSLGFTLNNPCIAGEKIVVANMRATSTNVYYQPLNIQISSSTSNSVTYNTVTSPFQSIEAGDELTFSNFGTPTTYTVSSVDYATRVITFTGTIAGATAGFNLYQYRALGSDYRPFTRYEVNLADATSYTPTEWQLRNGFELLFINGSSFNELDYDLGGNTISALPAPATGTMTVIQFNENSFGIPCANAANSLATTVEGQTVYAFPHNIDAFNLYGNGMIFAEAYDYTSSESLYTLLNTPDNSVTLLQQQTFARVGPA
jgi:hypothetical protein